jgi:2-keto-3-deoxy-L-arabinonate dehydratase
MKKRPYGGIWPVAPTPFTDDGGLDLEGMRRVIDCMVDQKVDGICILANFSEQFLLSDEERKALTRLCLEHAAGRVPVIVTISHFATQVAADRAREAAELGAAMVMMMPPYHGALLRADEEAVYEHFARVGEAGGIPIMVQDAPMSGVALSVPFLARMARGIEQVKLFKIETPQTAAKLRALIEAGGGTRRRRSTSGCCRSSTSRTASAAGGRARW